MPNTESHIPIVDVRNPRPPVKANRVACALALASPCGVERKTGKMCCEANASQQIYQP